MPDIEDFGVSIEEYLAWLESGIDVLELRRLESTGIPTALALEVMAIMERVQSGTATPEEVVGGLQILSPKLRQQLI
ncbi:hypothetical protein ACQ4M3_24385 [Leptolyngbya sp. AN03gr2]|uniref:hypothetical protein n=1 Tax=unclassified Leptolyngbya TaxID=2650499 RepID=UPI003D31C59C